LSAGRSTANEGLEAFVPVGVVDLTGESDEEDQVATPNRNSSKGEFLDSSDDLEFSLISSSF